MVAPLAGAGLALSFPHPGLALLLLPSLAVLFALMASAPPARAAAEGFVACFVFFALLLRWFGAVILDFSSLGPGVALGAVLGAGLLLGALGALVGWMAARAGGGRALLVLPPLWVAFEFAREAIPAPFPWGLLAAAFAGRPVPTAIVRAVGAHGFALLFAALAAALAGALLGRRWRAAAAAAAAGLAVAAAVGALLAPSTGGAGTVRVAVAQGAVGRDAAAADKLAVYEELTRRAAADGARLVVWPESATGLRIDAAPYYRAVVEDLARETGADILLGSVTEAEGKWFNSAALVRARGGLATVSSKRVLVPFGEYLPARALLGSIPALAAEGGDFSPGSAAVVHLSAAGPVGVLVCYEAVFPGLALDLARRGALLFANMTNDTWFGWTSGPEQHLQHALLRVPETGRPLLRAANGGISLIADADGRVLRRLELGERGVLVADVTPGRGAPIGAIAGRVIAWACAILSVALLLRSVRRRRAAAEPPTPEDSDVSEEDERAPAGAPSEPDHA